jgi:hypothetical protein
MLLVGLAASGAWLASAQPPPPPEYLFLDTVSTGAMTKNLEAAGRQGFVIHSASSLSMLLKRGEPTPRVYRLVSTTRETTLAKELNDLGAQAFRIVPSSVMEFAGEWVMALEQQPPGARFVYDVVKGDDQVEGKLNALRRQGGVLVGVVGKPPGEFRLTPSNPPPVLIVERAEGAPAGAAVTDYRIRIASTQKSSTLFKEVTALAAEGFRPIGSGFMTVVMERAPQTTPDPFEYKMVAATRRGTVDRELNDLASTGFRVMPKAVFIRQSEVVIFLRRTPGTTSSFHYILLEAKKTIDADLRQHAAEGYIPVGLVGGRVVILERAGKPTT